MNLIIRPGMKVLQCLRAEETIYFRLETGQTFGAKLNPGDRQPFNADYITGSTICGVDWLGNGYDLKIEYTHPDHGAGFISFPEFAVTQ